MPSPRHEALVMLLRERPSLLVELLRESLGVDLPVDVRARLASETLRQLSPIEVRADAVILLESRSSMMAIIAEAQLRPDPGKRRVWPSYVTLVHRDLGCTTLLVVLTVDQEVAAWCTEPIEVAPGFVLHPLVIGPSVVPRITDPNVAVLNVELAVLSALAHAGPEEPVESTAQIALAAIHAISRGAQVDEDLRADYADVVFGALSAAARSALEGLMSRASHEYQSDFAREYFAKGRVEGRVEGEAQGRAEGEARALLEILAVRGIAVGEARMELIRSCLDLGQLEAWIRRAVTATTEAEVFK